MGVVGTALDRAALPGTRARFLVWCPAIFYSLIVALTVSRHEPWADEAHSWLLARDLGLWELWTKLLHYEGTPGLWQTLLHVLNSFGIGYAGLNIFSGLLGLASALLVFRYAPFPAPLRVLLPFTFYLCYQYAVVARSYSLLPPLLFACAALYRRARHHLGLFTALLCLLALVSVHGIVLSIAIWASFLWSVLRQWRSVGAAERKPLVIAAAVYGAALALAVLAAWPAKDVTFVAYPNLAREHLQTASKSLFTEALTSEPIVSVLVVALSLPLLWRGGGLLMFALASVALCGISGMIYAQVWHQGTILLCWLFALWISWDKTNLALPATAALAIVMAFQIYWTVQSVIYDNQNAYSGGQETARYLKADPSLQKDLYAIGYACVAVQPYFSRNIFVNWSGGRGRQFWDWSSRNHMQQDLEQLATQRPMYVLLGYKTAAELMLWNNLVKKSGYQVVKRFEGNLFWREEVFEPESFNLYRRR